MLRRSEITWRLLSATLTVQLPSSRDVFWRARRFAWKLLSGTPSSLPSRTVRIGLLVASILAVLVLTVNLLERYFGDGDFMQLAGTNSSTKNTHCCRGVTTESVMGKATILIITASERTWIHGIHIEYPQHFLEGKSRQTAFLALTQQKQP